MFYSDEEVRIFEYYNGEKTLCVDPLDIQLKLMSDMNFDWDVLLMQWESSMEALGHFKEEGDNTEIDEKTQKKFAPELANAMEKLIAKSRSIFGLADLGKNEEGEFTGVPSSKVMEVLTSYMVFMNDVKKKDESTPTSAESTEQDGSEEQEETEDEDWDTENGSDYTSINDESNTEEAYL